MWSTEYRGESSAGIARLFAVLADTASWHEWNAGVAGIEIAGPFAAGTTAIMAMPDGERLPFRLVWVDPAAGFEDETPIPDARAVVRVRHELAAGPGGRTTITYRCAVDAPDEQAAAAIGNAVSADFPDVIAALAARAESDA